VGYRAWGAGDDALALELYARAAALAPALPVVEFDRAMLYAQRGDKALTEAAVKRGLALLESTPASTPQQSASVAEFRAAFERLRGGERPARPGLLGPAQLLPARFLTRPTAPARELPLDARSVRLYPAPLGGVLRLQVPTTWSERVRIEEDITAVQVVANAEADPESFFISAHPLPPGLTPAELVQKSRAELQREGAQVADAEPFRSDALQGSVVWAARPPGGGEGRYVGQLFATAGERLVTGTRLAPADAPADRAAFLEAMRSLSFQTTVPR
jgi:hypothetical protein